VCFGNATCRQSPVLCQCGRSLTATSEKTYNKKKQINFRFLESVFPQLHCLKFSFKWGEWDCFLEHRVQLNVTKEQFKKKHFIMLVDYATTVLRQTKCSVFAAPARCYAGAAFAVMRCLSVSVSVTFVDCVKMNKHIFFFSTSGSHTTGRSKIALFNCSIEPMMTMTPRLHCCHLANLIA